VASKEEIKQRVVEGMSFHPNTSQRVALVHDTIRERMISTTMELIDLTPESREQSLMLTHLEIALMFATKSVAVDQYEALEGGEEPILDVEDGNELPRD